jgi:hypothetical protein
VIFGPRTFVETKEKACLASQAERGISSHSLSGGWIVINDAGERTRDSLSEYKGTSHNSHLPAD